MTRTLVFPHQRLVLDIAQVGGVTVLHMQHVGQHVKALLRGLALVDDDGVVEVTTFDKVGLQQRLNITNEDESARTSNLVCIIMRIVECGKLGINELRFERAHGCNREVLIGQDCDARAGLFILYFNLLTDDVPVLGGVLFLNTHFKNFLNILDG